MLIRNYVLEIELNNFRRKLEMSVGSLDEPHVAATKVIIYAQSRISEMS